MKNKVVPESGPSLLEVFKALRDNVENWGEMDLPPEVKKQVRGTLPYLAGECFCLLEIWQKYNPQPPSELERLRKENRELQEETLKLSSEVERLRRERHLSNQRIGSLEMLWYRVPAEEKIKILSTTTSWWEGEDREKISLQMLRAFFRRESAE